ncbi:hypothetical protein RB195_015310 [Necator americanus]
MRVQKLQHLVRTARNCWRQADEFVHTLSLVYWKGKNLSKRPRKLRRNTTMVGFHEIRIVCGLINFVRAVKQRKS